jgi:hypothetical protein
MGRALKVVEREKEQSYVPQTISKTTDYEREEYTKKNICLKPWPVHTG